MTKLRLESGLRADEQESQSKGPCRSARQAQHTGQQAPRPFPSFLTFAQLMEPPPPPEWEVEPLFCQGDRVLVYGRSGAQKSWLLMHMGLCLAAGLPWLGKFGIKKPHKVLYIDKEMGESRTRRRTERLARGLGINHTEIEFVALVNPPFRADAESPDKLLTTFAERDWKPDIIIVEGLRRILMGNENNSQAVAECWANLAPLTEAGITFITSHHMVKGVSKKRSSGFDLIRGSGDLLAGVDVGLSVFRDFGTGPTYVIQDKARDGEEHAPFTVNVNFGADGTDPVTLEFAGEQPEVATRKVQQAATLILQYLRGQPEKGATRGDIEKFLADHAVARPTAARAFASLHDDATINNARRGYWQLTPELEDDLSPAA